MGSEDQKAFLQEVELEMDFSGHTRKNITKRKDRVVLEMHTGGTDIEKNRQTPNGSEMPCY